MFNLKEGKVEGYLSSPGINKKSSLDIFGPFDGASWP